MAQPEVERVPAIVHVAEPGPNGRWLYVSPQIELGDWVIEQACRDLTGWRSAHGTDAYARFNVSPHQWLT